MLATINSVIIHKLVSCLTLSGELIWQVTDISTNVMLVMLARKYPKISQLAVT